MHFTTDRQTIEDLNIFGKRGDSSVYSLFNHTQTRGGAMLMEQLFHEPLSRPEAIRKRIGIVRYFAGAGLEFPCKPEWFDAIEQYLANTDERTKLSHEDGRLGQRIADMITLNTEQAIIHKGVAAVVELVHACFQFVSGMAAGARGGKDGMDGSPYAEEAMGMRGVLGGGGVATGVE